MGARIYADSEDLTTTVNACDWADSRGEFVDVHCMPTSDKEELAAGGDCEVVDCCLRCVR
jgi:hypothetical protein